MRIEAEQDIRRELQSGERLLWTGSPRTGIRLQPADALLIPFSLLWGGFAVFWEASVIRTGAGGFFVFWGIPFVLVGLYITVGRFFYDAWRRARTVYGLTNDRAIIINGGFNREVRTVSLRTLGEVGVSERRDGSGTITFGSSNGVYGLFAGSGWPAAGRYAPVAFQAIDRVRDVQRRVTDAQKATLIGTSS
jgi:hypothetical protein